MMQSYEIEGVCFTDTRDQLMATSRHCFALVSESTVSSSMKFKGRAKRTVSYRFANDDALVDTKLGEPDVSD